MVTKLDQMPQGLGVHEIFPLHTNGLINLYSLNEVFDVWVLPNTKI